MRVWALYSTYVDPMEPPELLELFGSEEMARQALQGLTGRSRSQTAGGRSVGTWDVSYDVDELSDLYIKPLEVR